MGTLLTLGLTAGYEPAQADTGVKEPAIILSENHAKPEMFTIQTVEFGEFYTIENRGAAPEFVEICKTSDALNQSNLSWLTVVTEAGNRISASLHEMNRCRMKPNNPFRLKELNRLC